MPTWLNDSVDEPLLEQAQELWRGVNLAQPRTWRIAEDEAAALDNADRPDAGPLRTRPGSARFATLGGSVQGIGFYNTPAAEKLFVAAGGQLYRGDFNAVTNRFWAPGLVGQAIAPNPVFFAQLAETFFLTDGVALRKWTPAGGFEQVASPPANGLQFLCAHAGRLFAARDDDGSDGDVVYASDLLDGDTWDVARQAFNVGGSGDPIMQLIPWEDYLLLIPKRSSMWVVNTDPIADVVDWPIEEIPMEGGLVGPRAWCRTPNDIWILTDEGIHTLRRSQSQRNAEVSLPESEPIKPLLAALKPAERAQISATFWKNRVLFSLPGPEPKVAVYSTLTQKWLGTWSAAAWAANLYKVCTFAERRQLIWGQADGTLWQLLEDEPAQLRDAGTDVPVTVLTRGYSVTDEREDKLPFLLGVRFTESRGPATVSVSLDGGAFTQIWAGETSTCLRLPQTLPFNLVAAEQDRPKRWNIQHLGAFKVLQVKIQSTGEPIALGNLEVAAWRGRMPVELS